MKDPAFLFYPGDYLRDTQTLSEKTQVSYDRIMCEHMRNICISKQQLKFFTKKLSEDEIEELMFVLTKTDKGFMIEWVAESINKRKAYSESRRRNRSKKNKKDINNTSSSYEQHMENEDAIANEIIINNENLKNIKENYNSICKELKPIYGINEDRKNKILKILNEFKPNNIDDFFKDTFLKIKSSTFLNGHGPRGWLMTFDWMLEKDNFLKIIEGNYDNNEKAGTSESDDNR